MTTAEALKRGRESYGRQAWEDAYVQLSAADSESPLEGQDLEWLATAAYLAGRDEDSTELMTRAHNGCLRRGDVARAARCAFWIGFGLTSRGEMASAGGWFARAKRLLDDAGLDCVERGYLLLPMGLQSAGQGDFPGAHHFFEQAVAIGEKFREPDLIALARQGQGRALLRLDDMARGVTLLDEVMASVIAGDVSPAVAGVVYCSVIDACQEMFDLRRAREWTSALTSWCDAQEGLVPYRGQCLIHRAEIMQVRGAWQDAMEEAARAYERLSRPPGHPAIGGAYYRQAELHRLRGEFDRAEEAYRLASQWGHSPEPGLALLRLARGQTGAAVASIRRAMDETVDHVARAKLFAVCVEVLLAAGDTDAARATAADLAKAARDFNAPFLQAAADNANGAVCLASGDARAALTSLRRAWAAWQELEVPYEAARARVLIGLSVRELGDEISAEMELDSALRMFQQLGAAPDAARVEDLLDAARAPASGGLTGREVEVLRLVAAGKTNRAIAAELVISEKTVARHISNIFAKLDLSSRSAATAYAYEHSLL